MSGRGSAFDYPANILRWWWGWFHFREIDFKPGWSAASPAWWALYLLDYGFCVLVLAGRVESVSRFAQSHRSGWFWDGLLDLVERLDRDHGPLSGPPLWDSRLPPLWVRVLVPLTWAAVGVFAWRA